MVLGQAMGEYERRESDKMMRRVSLGRRHSTGMARRNSDTLDEALTAAEVVLQEKTGASYWGMAMVLVASLAVMSSVVLLWTTVE